MLTSSIPVAGIVVALFAAAASVSATALTAGVLVGRYSPVHIGLLYLPEVGGAVITAVALGLVIRRRAMHYLPLVGMVLLAAGIAVFRIEVPSSQALTLVGSGLTGIGLGATVAPALFVAGFSLPAANLQRVFAIVELLRAVAAFMVAPIFVHFAATVGGNLDAGTGDRPVDRPRARARRRRDRRRHLRARRRAPADARPRALPGRDDPGLVLATAAGTGSARSPVAEAEPTEIAPDRPGHRAGRRRSGARPGAVRLRRLRARELAIEQAGADSSPAGREALVLCVWQPADVGFVPVGDRHFDADRAAEVSGPPRRPPHTGQRSRPAAGFRSQSVAVEAAPTWKGIVETAEEHQASLIVLGSHRRSGLVGHLLGSVAAAVVAHATPRCWSSARAPKPEPPAAARRLRAWRRAPEEQLGGSGQDPAVLGVHPGQPAGQPLRPASPGRLDAGAAGLGEREEDLAPILRVVRPGDEPELLQPGDRPRHRGRLDPFALGELAGRPGATEEGDEDGVLAGRDRARAGLVRSRRDVRRTTVRSSSATPAACRARGGRRPHRRGRVASRPEPRLSAHGEPPAGDRRSPPFQGCRRAVPPVAGRTSTSGP